MFDNGGKYIAKKGIVRTSGRRLVVRHPINFHIVR
jgi:hypothetical protein